MNLPYLNAPSQSVDMLTQFGGLNKNLIASENEFSDMKNMTASQFPMAATRGKRGKIRINGRDDPVDGAIAIHSKDRLLMSYTQKGRSDYEFAENVVIDPVDGIRQSDGTWTTRVDINTPTEGVNLLKGLQKNSQYDEFSYLYCFGESNKCVPLDYFSDDETNPSCIYVKFPHLAIPYTHYVYRKLGTVKSVSKEYDPNDESVVLNTYYEIQSAIPSADIPSNLRDYWGFRFGESKEFKNTEFVDFYYSNNIYVIKYDGEEITSKVGDSVYFRYGEGFWISPNAAKDDSDLYQTAYIKAKGHEEAMRLKGKTLDVFGKPVEVTAVYDKGNNNYELKLKRHERVHKEEFDENDPYDKQQIIIPEGFTTIEDRLWLAEINPETGKMVSTNLCVAAEGKRNVCEMGAYLVFFPEKIMVNTNERGLNGEFTQVEKLEKTNTLICNNPDGSATPESSFRYKMVDVNGYAANPDNKETFEAKSATAPDPSLEEEEAAAQAEDVTEEEIAAEIENNEQDGFVWIDTTHNPPEIKKWSKQTNSWAQFAPYVELSHPSIAKDWEVGDAFEFVEFDGEKNPIKEFVTPKENQKYFVISAVGEDDKGIPYIRFPCAMNTSRHKVETENGTRLTLRRAVPDMDYLIESENRLWGCKYGVVNGKMINEIFASKQGDPKNWHFFANTALDSYYASLGSDGEFTGAITYNANPLFFREDTMHRVFGNYPANYSVKTYSCHGVEKGSANSLVIMNEVLYYNSPMGLMAYGGAAPVKISESMGADKLRNVYSGAQNHSLYVSADVNGKRKLYVFNDYYKLWHIEDDLNIKSLAVYNNETYALTEDGYLYSLNGVYGEPEADFDWLIETANIGFMSPFNKYIFKINARLLMGLGSNASVSIQYDSSGDWEHVSMIAPKGKTGSVSIPIKPHRCDHFALRFSGKGDCKLMSLTKYTEEGSDIV